MDFAAYLSPLLSRICEYTTFKSSGVEIPYETMLSELHAYLSDLESKCRASPQLQENYRKVERAVIFFIDYTVKESGFSYSERYTELARDFNELSGDEKFFDLLNESLARNDAPEVLQVFYLMLGLGFDGAFKHERPKVLELMNRLRQELPPTFDPRSDYLCPELKQQPQAAAVPQRPWWWWIFSKRGLISLGLFTLAMLILNMASFNWSVNDFVDAIEQASLSARPYQQP